MKDLPEQSSPSARLPAPSPPAWHWDRGRAVGPAELLPGSCPSTPRDKRHPGTHHAVRSTCRGSEVSHSMGAGPAAHGCVAQLALGAPTGENTGNVLRGVHTSPAMPAPALLWCPAEPSPEPHHPSHGWEQRVGMWKRCPGSCCAPTAPLPHCPPNSDIGVCPCSPPAPMQWRSRC